MKALLVECLAHNTKPRMDEVSDIAKSAGYEISSQITQHRDVIDSKYYVGEGKLSEIEKTIKNEPVDAVIFTGQLSAGQVFRIKKQLGYDVNVLDRNLLILEIFGKRSTTTEARLQIELARLRYTFSWAREAVRTRGIVSEQMGRGGPGQYPYEVYEALSRKRISKIEGQLRVTRQKQSSLREHRGKAGFRIAALTGYTQSGKTTLFNNLASESKETGLGPFTTLSTFARRIDTANMTTTHPVIMIDSIGFIEDLNPILLNAFHTTLNELANSDLILLFVDASDDRERFTRKIAASQEIMKKELSNVPVLICVNKIDLITDEHLDWVIKETRKAFENEETLTLSAKTGANVPDLLSKIRKRLGDFGEASPSLQKNR